MDAELQPSIDITQRLGANVLASFTANTDFAETEVDFLVGLWGLATKRYAVGSDATSHGFKVDYPNDEWDLALTYKRIGRDFDPSIGFVPRRAAHIYNLTVNNRTRLPRGPIQQLFHEFEPLHGHGHGTEAAFLHTGGLVVWGFYNGELNQLIWNGAWNPAPLVTIEFSGERHVGRLATGRFTQTLLGSRLRINVSPDLSLASYVQYDTDSRSLGTNTRLRWTFLPVADLFVVYNHNVRSLLERWQLESNQLLVKLQYAWRL